MYTSGMLHIVGERESACAPKITLRYNSITSGLSHTEYWPVQTTRRAHFTHQLWVG